MAVYRDTRRASRPWVIDITYVDRRTGKKVRYFRNAKLQTADGARSEERTLLGAYAVKGYIPGPGDVIEEPKRAPAITFKQAYELYQKTLEPTLKPSTSICYRKTLDAHLLPRFGEVSLSAIDRAALVVFDQELVRAGLSASTRNNIVIPLRTIIGNAIELKRYNGTPDFAPLAKVKSKVYQPPSMESVEKVIAAAGPRSPGIKVALALAAYAGLRASEVRGLRWVNVDLARDLLFVREAITHGVVVDTKSGHERAIPITPVLKDILDIAAKAPHAPNDPVAPSRDGTAMSEDALRSGFRRALQAANLPHTRLHDLRHFFITQCFVGGAGAPTVQKLAGHLHLSTTQRYAHTDADLMRQAVLVLSKRRPASPRESDVNGASQGM